MMTTDYATIGAVMQTLYACISGPPGGQDWARDREVYHEKALIMRTRIVDNVPVIFPFDYDGFMYATVPILKDISFYEIEIGRKTEIFGQIAHVYSSYEARETPDSAELLFRGINMVHLWNDGIVGTNAIGVKADGEIGRWWIMSIIWDNERPGVTLPLDWLTAV